MGIIIHIFHKISPLKLLWPVLLYEVKLLNILYGENAKKVDAKAKQKQLKVKKLRQ